MLLLAIILAWLLAGAARRPGRAMRALYELARSGPDPPTCTDTYIIATPRGHVVWVDG